jgi:hypothetical protein
MEPSWGTGIAAARSARVMKGLWLMFPAPPVIEPWGAYDVGEISNVRQTGEGPGSPTKLAIVPA